MDHETAEVIKRHFNVVAEGLRSDIRLVIDALAANTAGLDRVERRLDSLEARFDRLEIRFDGLATTRGVN
jgi:ubiquinone biosynthesis protein UbiJ